MITSTQLLRRGLIAAILAVTVGGPVMALPPGQTPANRRPKMPPKPPVLGIPNGGRQGAWQPGHGAFGNIQGSAAGSAAGQTGQFGQGGGLGGGGVGGFGSQGAFGGAGGGLAAFGQFGSGGGLGGGLLGGLKGFSVGGGLLGPEAQYSNGVGLYGGRPTLDGSASDREAVRTDKPSVTYHVLMLHPVVAKAVDGR